MTKWISVAPTGIDDRADYQHYYTYDVGVDNFTIHTIVTRSVNIASTWLRETNSIINNSSNNSIVIGLTAQFRSCKFPDATNFPVTTLVLCLNDRCLIYQILQRSFTANDNRCEDLKSFLEGSDYTFVGVDGLGIIAALLMDFDWEVPRMVDLSELGKTLKKDELPEGGNVKKLAEVFLKKDIYEPMSIEIKDWGGELPDMSQVMYGVYDAHLCEQIGIVMEAYKYDPIVI